jgi:hypothetical protein
MKKFSSQLPKDDLKKFAKEVGKKLVASDFKNNRVQDPTKISEKQEKKVKSYVKEYFEKAVEKKKAIDRKKREKEKLNGVNGTPKGEEKGKGPDVDAVATGISPSQQLKDDSDIEMSDNEEDKALIASFAQPSPSIPSTPTDSFSDLKRKREDELLDTPGEESDSKRLKEEENDESEVSPPPPPPPPPAGEMPDLMDEDMLVNHVKEETEEEKELRLQEEALMRENEEALMMEMDGSLKAEELDGKLHDHIPMHFPPSGLNGGKDIVEEGIKVEHERTGVLSH